MIEVVFGGVGGQGVVLASRMMALILMEEGYSIKSTETIGMAQMGGAVTSHLRASKGLIHSPFVRLGGADYIIAFEPAEAVRNAKYAGPEAMFLINERGIKPVTDTLAKEDYNPDGEIESLKRDFEKVHSLDLEGFLEELGSKRPLNIIYVGMAMALMGISKALGLEVLGKNIPERFLVINEKAFEEGYRLGEKVGKDS